MPKVGWVREVCEDILCGGGLGIVKGLFRVALFTEKELEEVHSLKKLALSVIEKSPNITTDSVICESIKRGEQIGLENFIKNAPPEAVKAGVVTAAELVCNKSFKARFTKVLMGACLNLVGC
jgi:hypothetical protein